MIQKISLHQFMVRIITAGAWLALLTFAVLFSWSWSTSGIAYDLVRLDMDAPAKLQKIRYFFADCGHFAPVVYFAMVTIEVIIAPIPGLMLYAPGGAIFGPVLGGALSLAGNVVGAGIACVLAKSVRPRWMDRCVSTEKAKAMQCRLEQHGGWLIFFLRLNPLTSSDIVSYAAGFTRIPITTVMLATCGGMAPLCFAQAWLAASLLETFPNLLYVLVAGLVVYVLVAVFVIVRLVQPRNSSHPDSFSK